MLRPVDAPLTPRAAEAGRPDSIEAHGAAIATARLVIGAGGGDDRPTSRRGGAVAIAWIGVVSGLLATAASVVLAVRQQRSDVTLERLRGDVDAELHRSEGLIDRELIAQDVLARYREPLAVAAFDLQSRLYNILRL